MNPIPIKVTKEDNDGSKRYGVPFCSHGILKSRTVSNAALIQTNAGVRVCVGGGGAGNERGLPSDLLRGAACAPPPGPERRGPADVLAVLLPAPRVVHAVRRRAPPLVTQHRLVAHEAAQAAGVGLAAERGKQGPGRGRRHVDAPAHPRGHRLLADGAPVVVRVVQGEGRADDGEGGADADHGQARVRLPPGVQVRVLHRNRDAHPHEPGHDQVQPQDDAHLRRRGAGQGCIGRGVGYPPHLPGPPAYAQPLSP